MANREGGGSGFGWLALGVLLGVAGTLALQMLYHRHYTSQEARAPEERTLVIAPAAAPEEVRRPARIRTDPAPVRESAPTPEIAPIPASPAPIQSPRQPDPATPNNGQVADDAAATGMTSRATN